MKLIKLIFRKKFKSILNFKRNLRLLKILSLILWKIFLIFGSFVEELLFLSNLKNWVIQWMNLIHLLMTESVFITRIVYFLYLILLGMFGMIIGFVLGIYTLGISSCEDEIKEIYIFLLLLFLQVLYNSGFDEVLLEHFPNLSLGTKTIEPYSKISLKSIEQINPHPLKITFKESEKMPLPFLIIEDPYFFIETEVLWDESTNYKFRLFEFSRYVNQKGIIN